MSPICQASSSHAKRLSRTRGDEPTSRGSPATLRRSAPHARGWAQRVGVVCRTRGQLSRVVAGLADHGIDAVQTKNAELASHEQVSVMTMHGAKGMEFTHVILMGVGKEIMPLRFRLKNLSEQDARAALQRERSLLYVAASRARDALVVTTVGERSELLPEG